MKKALKPILLMLGMILVAIIIVIIYDKFTSKPEEAVKGMLTGLKNNNIDMVNTYANYKDIFNSVDSNNQENENNNLKLDVIDPNNDNLKLILNNMSYEIMNDRIENDKAVVTVSITSMDLKEVFSQYFGQYVKIAFASDGVNNNEQNSDNKVSIKETMNEYLKSLITAENKKMVTTVVELNLKKENGNWKVNSNMELTKALLPGIDSVVEYLKNMNDILQSNE